MFSLYFCSCGARGNGLMGESEGGPMVAYSRLVIIYYDVQEDLFFYLF
jgi:hypothetical protein